LRGGGWDPPPTNKLAAATIPADKELYQRQIEGTDEQIDALVYELSGLTHEEMDVVEELRQFHCQKTRSVCWRQGLFFGPAICGTARIVNQPNPSLAGHVMLRWHKKRPPSQTGR